MKFHHSYIHRVISDHQIRQTNQFSAQEKFTEEELIDIQSELESKIRTTPANRIINGWFNSC